MSLSKSEISDILNTMSNILTRLIDRVENDTEFEPQERREILNTMYEKICGIQLSELLDETNKKHKLQIKRGDKSSNDQYTGLSGEITMDTDTKTLRVHDGETVGGTTLARTSDIPPEFHFPFPDFSAESSIDTSAGSTFVLPCDALVCVRVGGNSCLAVNKDNANGVNLFYQENTNSNTVLASMILPKDTNLYILRRSGTYAQLSYYPIA